MIAFLSKWAEGIVIAVVIATIIELILPNTNNKKYVKMIVGVYIVFTIISPIVNEFCEVDFSALHFEEMQDVQTQTKATTAQAYTNNYITNLYTKNLQKDMHSKLEAKGYEADKIVIQIDEKSDEMPIQAIRFEGVHRKQEGVQMIQRVEIREAETQEYTLEKEEIEALKEYFSQTYAVLKENIEI